MSIWDKTVKARKLWCQLLGFLIWISYLTAFNFSWIFANHWNIVSGESPVCLHAKFCFCFCFVFSLFSYDSSGTSKDEIKERFAQTMEFVEEYLRDVVCQRFPFSDKEKNKLTFEVVIQFSFLSFFSGMCYFFQHQIGGQVLSEY